VEAGGAEGTRPRQREDSYTQTGTADGERGTMYGKTKMIKRKGMLARKNLEKQGRGSMKEATWRILLS